MRLCHCDGGLKDQTPEACLLDLPVLLVGGPAQYRTSTKLARKRTCKGRPVPRTLQDPSFSVSS